VLATIVNVSDRPIVAIFVGLFFLGFMLFLIVHAPKKSIHRARSRAWAHSNVKQSRLTVGIGDPPRGL
jgi:hypothetical protein